MTNQVRVASLSGSTSPVLGLTDPDLDSDTLGMIPRTPRPPVRTSPDSLERRRSRGTHQVNRRGVTPLVENPHGRGRQACWPFEPPAAEGGTTERPIARSGLLVVKWRPVRVRGDRARVETVRSGFRPGQR